MTAKPFAIGDRVVFARAFLRCIGAVTGDLPFQRGTVTLVREQRQAPDVITVQWDHGGTSRSLACNLWHLDRLHLEPV